MSDTTGKTSETTGEMSELAAQAIEVIGEFAPRNFKEQKERRILQKQFGHFAGVASHPAETGEETPAAGARHFTKRAVGTGRQFGKNRALCI
jgi:hypothetical protein